MSYHDVTPDTAHGKVGKRIYMEALSDRRGFRDDQLGIEDHEIWNGIFEDIGRIAIDAVLSIQLRSTSPSRGSNDENTE